MMTQSMTKDDMAQMFDGETEIKDYPRWAKTTDQINEMGHKKHGLWTYFKGPPFLNRVTMFSGNDVDITRSGNIVRRVAGLKKISESGRETLTCRVLTASRCALLRATSIL